MFGIAGDADADNEVGTASGGTPNSFLPNVLFCGEPLNNGQPKSRHRRHSPSSLPRDRFLAKSIETETRQLRENPPCSCILRVSA